MQICWSSPHSSSLLHLPLFLCALQMKPWVAQSLFTLAFILFFSLTEESEGERERELGKETPAERGVCVDFKQTFFRLLFSFPSLIGLPASELCANFAIVWWCRVVEQTVWSHTTKRRKIIKMEQIDEKGRKWLKMTVLEESHSSHAVLLWLFSCGARKFPNCANYATKVEF